MYSDKNECTWLAKEMVFRCHAQTVHGLYVTVFVNGTTLWSMTNFKHQFLTLQWGTPTDLHNVCSSFIIMSHHQTAVLLHMYCFTLTRFIC